MDKTRKLMASVTAASAMLLATGCSNRNNCDPRTNPNCTSSSGGYYSGGHYYGGGGGGYVHSSGGGWGGFGGSHGSSGG